MTENFALLQFRKQEPNNIKKVLFLNTVQEANEASVEGS
jgi:hypothetical protein